MSDVDPASLLAQALRLSPKSRLALADELLDSVEEPDESAWTSAWATELDERLRQLETGEAKAVPWPEARARILAKLRAR